MRVGLKENDSILDSNLQLPYVVAHIEHLIITATLAVFTLDHMVTTAVDLGAPRDSLVWARRGKS